MNRTLVVCRDARKSSPSLWAVPLLIQVLLVACLLCTVALRAGFSAPATKSSPVDLRNIRTGWEIPTLTYSDQPYIVKTADGAWLCAVTTGAGREGAPGQTVVTMRSTDQGRTWSAPVAIEPPTGPEASYAVLLKVPSGRIFIFYNHNTDNLREVRADDPPFRGGVCKRVDSLGYFVFKFSDDGGRSWSPRRYPIPMREMDIDRRNAYGGRVRFFWNVGKPFLHAGTAFVSLHKVGGFGEGFFTRSEGVLLVSANLAHEPHPENITWTTRPEGQFGLRTPPGGGPIAEEQSYAVLSDNSFYCVYRTIDGHPACALSRDLGRTWTTPQYQSYADGRLMKHPRAANFLWKCANGNYLYWFHNHGGRFIREHPRRATNAYEDRNPVWLCGGVEADTPAGKVIRWSQPEIVLYDDDPYLRMSYPDLVEDGGQYYLTETQKDVARVHRIDRQLLEGLWNQFTNRRPVTAGTLVALPAAGQPMPQDCPLPTLPAFTQRDSTRADYGTKDLRAGFTVDLWLRLNTLDAGQTVLDNRTPSGRGFALQTTSRGTLELVLHDGRSESRWDCDPGLLHPGQLQHVSAIVDGGPKIITFVVDARLSDGGDFRQFGWGRFTPHYRGPTGDATLRIAPDLKGEVKALRLYARALRTSEAIANFRAGCP
jgi:hypothetical protein